MTALMGNGKHTDAFVFNVEDCGDCGDEPCLWHNAYACGMDAMGDRVKWAIETASP